VRKDIQELLAGVRTDLDSFSDLESYALMTSGYLAAEQALKGLEDLPMAQAEPPHKWRFLEVAEGMTQEQADSAEHRRLSEHLKVSDMTFFKVWKLYRPLNLTAKSIGLALLIGLVYLWITNPGLTFSDPTWEAIKQSLTLGNLMTTFGLVLLGMLVVNVAGRFAGQALQLIRFREALYRVLVGLGVGIVGWLGAWVHLHVFDVIFKRLGRVGKNP
jgi:hypothetical protein